MSQLPKDHAGTPILDPSGAVGPPGPPGPAGASAIAVNRIDSGNIGGSQLIAIDTTALQNGTIANVSSVGDLFDLETNPSAAVIAATDGITIVQPTANAAHRWVRRMLGGLEFAFVSAWFVNSAAGNDDNDGLGAGTALATIDELARRLNGANIIQDTLTTLAAGAYSPVQFNITIESGVVFEVLGNVTSSAARQITAVTATSPSTGVRGAVTDPAPLWVDQSRLRLTDGAMSGALAYVTKIVSGTQANVSRWGLLTSVLSHDLTVGEPAVNDHYVVDTLNSTVGLLALMWQTQGRFAVRDCIVDGIAGATSPGGSFGLPALIGCHLTGGALTIAECELEMLLSKSDIIVTLVNAAVTSSCHVWHADLNVDAGSIATFPYPQCFDGSSVSLQNGGNIFNFHASAACDVQFVDNTGGYAVKIRPGSAVDASGALALWWGANNALITAAFILRQTATFVYTTKPTIPGGATDVYLTDWSALYAATPIEVNTAIFAERLKAVGTKMRAIFSVSNAAWAAPVSLIDMGLRPAAGSSGGGGGGGGGKSGATGAGGGGGRGGGPGGSSMLEFRRGIQVTKGDLLQIDVGAGGTPGGTAGTAGAVDGAGGTGGDGAAGGFSRLRDSGGTTLLRAAQSGNIGGAAGIGGGGGGAGAAVAGGTAGSTGGTVGLKWGPFTGVGIVGAQGGVGGPSTAGANGSDSSTNAATNPITWGTNPILASNSAGIHGNGNGVGLGGGGGGGPGGNAGAADEYYLDGVAPSATAGRGGNAAGHGGDFTTNTNGTAGADGTAGTQGRGGGGGQGGGGGGAGAVGFAGGAGKVGSDGYAVIEWWW